MASKIHLLSIDLIRIISFLAILTIHVTKVIFESKTQVDVNSWWWAMFFGSMARFGTPMFVMVSGYLLLDSESVKNTKDFYKKRLSVIIWPMIFWNLFYYWLYGRLNPLEYGWRDFWVRFLSGGTYYHLYFLQLILGLYLVTPLLSKIKDYKYLGWIIFILFLISFGYLYTYTSGYFPELNNTFLWFIPYIGYYLAGYWIGKQSKKISWWWGLVAIGLLLLGVWGQGNYLANRLSLNVALASVILFWLILSVKRLPEKLVHVGKYGMGLYLFHPLAIEIFRNEKYLAGLTYSHSILWMILAYLGSGMITIGAVFIMKRNRFLAKLI